MGWIAYIAEAVIGLVTMARYYDLPAAEVACSVLNAAGIPAFVFDRQFAYRHVSQNNQQGLTMHFHDFFRSSAAHRVRIAINLKGIDCARTSVVIPKGENRAPEYRALNPLGIVPTMVDGGAAITQSIAIIEYLDELHPDPPLLPGAPAARARVRALAQTIACEIHPLNIGRVVNFLSGELNVDEAGVEHWSMHWLTTGMDALEALLNAGPGAGKFCHGDSPTLADICLIPQAYNAVNRFKLDLAGYPAIQRIYETCQSLPAFAGAAPDAQA